MLEKIQQRDPRIFDCSFLEREKYAQRIVIKKAKKVPLTDDWAWTQNYNAENSDHLRQAI